MPIIQRIMPAPSTETAVLYSRGQGTRENLPAQTHLSFNTYFNSYHEASFARHCDFGDLTYEFRLQGDFRVRLLRAGIDEPGEDSIHEIASIEALECVPEKLVTVGIPSPETEPGRIYAELTCLKDGGAFLNGHLVASRRAVRDVDLAIIICTFRKEEFVKQTVAVLTGDPALREKSIQVYIADNAGTLTPEMFPDERIHLFPGKNAGGAGGFTRGLIEAYEGSAATHFLVMDDDVELESESILRLITFQEYAEDNPAVAGAMLNLSEKTELVTAGNDFDRAPDTGAPALFTVRSLHGGADLSDPEVLTRLNRESRFDYGGFWFFAFDREVLHELAYPLPFFIKGDDAEYGIRTGSIRKLTTLPGVCVWHEPPERKPLTWEIYYHYRNMLIIHDLHYTYGARRSLGTLARYFLHGLFTFRYGFCELMLRALRDYRRGPEYLGNLDPETVHGEIRTLAGKHPGGVSVQVDEDQAPAKRSGILKQIFVLACLGGHLWPSAIGGRRTRPLAERDIKYYSVFPAHRYVSRTEFAGDYEYSKKSWTGLRLTLRFLAHAGALLVTRRGLRKRWRDSRFHLTSATAWKKYLDLETGS